MLLVELSGICSEGSEGENYGEFIYQQIGVALLTLKPVAILIDLRNLEYTFGDRIVKLFQIFSDIDIFHGEGFITAFVISDKNKHGISSLLNIDLNNPDEGFYYDTNEAYQYLVEQLEMI